MAKSPLEKLNNVIKALELLEDAKASISIKVPVCDQTENFIRSNINNSPIIKGVLQEDDNLIITFNTPLAQFESFGNLKE